ncbi:hypothetical protein GSS88_04740 [Corynebacterium sp. 3HC-13]|uniref:hypothetical protein n=1 Tax=Corynebacterium poyangense TaxID=2684405 RepID=UPI001CCFB138|nr:hypothetical protein [Corynebacterium poyangense]MBZ8177107.1 hypothetical protein [Corynebacterium poyangense]
MAQAYAGPSVKGPPFRTIADIIAGETGDLRTVPILLQEGITGDSVARTAALLDGIYIDRGPRCWQLTSRPRSMSHVIADSWERKLDLLEEQWGTDLNGLVIPLLGPWTFSTRIEHSAGRRALEDQGFLAALHDIYVASLEQVHDNIAQRFGTSPHLVLVEPDLYRIQHGLIPGPTDFDLIPERSAEDLADYLAELCHNERGGTRILSFSHFPICWDIARFSGARVVDFDFAAIRHHSDLDGLGELLNCHVTPSVAVDPTGKQPKDLAKEIIRLSTTVGFAPTLWAKQGFLRMVDSSTDSAVLEELAFAQQLRTVAQTADILHSDAGNL